MPRLSFAQGEAVGADTGGDTGKATRTPAPLPRLLSIFRSTQRARETLGLSKREKGDGTSGSTRAQAEVLSSSAPEGCEAALIPSFDPEARSLGVLR